MVASWGVGGLERGTPVGNGKKGIDGDKEDFFSLLKFPPFDKELPSENGRLFKAVGIGMRGNFCEDF